MTQTQEIIAAQHRRDDPICAPCDEASADRPQRRRDVVLHELDGEALLFDPETQSTHRLNATGFLIWSSCDGTTGVDVIADRLSEVYAVGCAEAKDHVARFIAALRKHGLIVDSRNEPLRSSVPDSGIDRDRRTS